MQTFRRPSFALQGANDTNLMVYVRRQTQKAGTKRESRFGGWMRRVAGAGTGALAGSEMIRQPSADDGSKPVIDAASTGRCSTVPCGCACANHQRSEHTLRSPA